MAVNDPIQLAAAMINRTAKNVFLTGKAGTGKTTFLKKLAEETHKNYIIVAPTGIAALNAGGATIHSTFSLPFGSFIPEAQYRLTSAQERGFYTREILFKNNSLSKARKHVLQTLELLVIDEVSMLRADTLDAIDVRLKYAKNIWDRPFGGVQVLFIGDLFQLPPIVKDEQRAMLQRYYQNAYFYHSIALRQSGLVYIELEKIFRQQEGSFIEILNNLRQNRISAEDRDALNEYYRPNAKPEQGVITLATHNRQVDEINEKALRELKGKSFTYRAKIEGDFPESMYPCEKELELKVGAQVMFVRNDSSQDKRFYNGKIAEVVSLDEDEICVILDGEEDEFYVPKENWENAKYAVEDDSLSPELEVLGTFTQFPLKLAWAVTVHKSQGLTFDKAIIDVGRAFAPGQVYVALSRLRSLDGLILKTPIPLSGVQSDADVVHFSKDRKENTNHVKELKSGQESYAKQLVLEAFDFTALSKLLDKTIGKWQTPLPFHLERMSKWSERWLESVGELMKIGVSFQGQLFRLSVDGDGEKLIERLEKGTEYFESELKKIFESLYGFRADISRAKGIKQMTNDLEEVDQYLLQKWKRISEVLNRAKALYTGKVIEKNEKDERRIVEWRKDIIQREKNRAAEDKELGAKGGRVGKKRGKLKSGKSTYEETFDLYDQGLTVKEIAEKRDLTEATVLGHMSRGISQERVDIKKLLEPERLEEIVKTYPGGTSLSEWRDATNKRYSFQELRLVLAEIQRRVVK